MVDVPISIGSAQRSDWSTELTVPSHRTQSSIILTNRVVPDDETKQKRYKQSEIDHF